jgi:hypothetical protein
MTVKAIGPVEVSSSIVTGSKLEITGELLAVVENAQM